MDKYLKNKTDIWIYDFLTRDFHDEGYSWEEAQRKASDIMGIES